MFLLQNLKLVVPNKKCAQIISVILLIGLFNGCSTVVEKQDSAPEISVDTSNIENPVPKAEPLSKYGNPASYEVAGKRYYVMNSRENYTEQGIASWYGTKFHGRRTSSGETYDMYAMTAAHKTLPIPTYVSVKNLDNQKQIIVRVNDRGPFHGDRIIDLSYVAALKLDIVKTGTGRVEVRSITNHGTIPPSQSSLNTVGNKNIDVIAPVSQHYLQVGAFSDRRNAENMVRELSLHTSAPIHIRNGERFYRVRIGPFPERAQAQAIETQLSDLGLNDAHVVVDQ